MGTRTAGLLLQQVRKLAADGGDEADGRLLERFAEERDEAAFTALVHRHGAMVLSVCRGILRHEQDAEDAFQATFLALARKADSIRRRQSVASWLHEVAHRVALRARANAARRRADEPGAEPAAAADPVLDLTLRDVQRVVHEELRRLPEQYRAPLVLCYLQARTQDEAARQLGCTEAALRGRLHRGRRLLRARLSGRDLSLATGLLPTMLSGASAALPPALAASAVRTGLLAAGAVPPAVAELAAGALRSGALARLRGGALALFALALVGMTAAGQLVPAAPQEKGPELPAQPMPQAKEAQPPAQPPPQVKEAKGPAIDIHGDPLPPGAIARMGTNRFRHPGPLYAVAYSPNGKLIASAGGDRTVRLWDAATGRELRRLQDDLAEVQALAFSHDGKTLAAACDSPIRLWDVATGKEVAKLGGYLVDIDKWRQKFLDEGRRDNYVEPPFEGHRGRVWSLAFSPDGKSLASAGGDLLLWDLGKRKLTRTLQDAKRAVHLVAFSPDGKRLAVIQSGNPGTAYQDTVLSLWDVPSGQEVRRVKAHKQHVNCVAFSPDGQQVATGAIDHTVTVWNADTLREVRTLRLESGGSVVGVAAVAFSPDARTLAVATSGDGAAHLLDAATGKELRRIKGHAGPLRSVAFSPDSRTLATASAGNGAVRLWDVATGADRMPLGGNDSAIVSVAFSPGGLGSAAPLLATTGGDRTIRLWDALTGKEVRRIEESLSWMSGVVFTPDGKSVVSRSYENGVGYRLGVWDVATGKLLRRLGKHPETVLRLAGDGKTLLAASGPKLELWDVATGKEVRQFTGHKDRLYCVTGSRDGKFVAARDEAGAVLLWETATGNLLRGWPAEKSILCRTALSPDGKLLAVGDQDGWVRLWDTATGAEVLRFQAHRATARDFAAVRSLAFSPRGTALVSGGYDGTLVLWEVATGRERRRFPGHQGELNELTWSADGVAIASASYDGTALVWDVTGHLDGGRLRATPLPAERLRVLWADLADRDAGRAHAALWALAAGAKDAVPFLAERLHAVTGERAQHEQWIKQLDDERFAVRQEAMAQLERTGKLAERALRAALKGRPSLEVRRRLEQLLESLGRPVPSPEALRELRAIEALRHAGTPGAVALLRRLAGGAAGARQTGAARRAVDSLPKRPDPVP